MKPLTLLLLLGMLVLPGQLPGQTEADTRSGCGQLYQSGRYREAAACYQRELSGRYEPARLYNLANSYARMGHTGQAVLQYQRALCLAPGDSDILANLQLVRSDHGIFPVEQTWFDQRAAMLSVGQWSLLALAGPTVYLLFQLRRLGKPRRGVAIEILVLCSCLGLTLAAVTGAARGYHQWRYAVVLEDHRVLLSPYDGAESIGSIKSGRLARTLKEHRSFCYIIDETGRKGWLEQDVLEPILPTPPGPGTQ